MEFHDDVPFLESITVSKGDVITFALIILSLLLGYWIGSISKTTESTTNPIITTTTITPGITVNLPPGQKFENLMSADQAREFGFYGGKIYTTSERFVNEKPRKITLLIPGGHPGTWNALMYIQEH